MSVLDNPRIKKLLNCFDANTQNYLLDFCDRISNMQADVFIIMARKASCFYNCLEELGMIHFNGYVTSERILDMPTDWLEGMSVIIIDDALVSGTSIYKTINKLKEAHVRSIDVHVLTVNEKWFQPALLKDDDKDYLFHNCNKQPDPKCVELCYNVVNAILIQPRPYDIDFPLYQPIKIDPFKFDHIIGNIGWSCYDVSSAVQIENNVFSLSIIPNTDTLRKFSKKIGFNLNDECFVKIRVFGTHISKKKEMYELRVVPMVVLNKLSAKDIDNLFDQLLCSSAYTQLKGDFISQKSKLRLLQFYFAVKLSELWFDDIDYILNIDKKELIKFSERNLSFLFPKELVQYVDSICQENYIFNFNNPCTSTKNSVQEISLPAIDPISIKTILTQPFLDMYYSKELLCREYVKKLEKEVFLNDDYKELRQRLDQGITFAELKSKICSYSDICDINTTVSLFLDQAIDVGIAVPIIEEDNEGFLSRAYRHGEDVLFGKREEILYGEMLFRFQEAANRPNGLTHLSVEKMIVLFTRIGVAKKILRPYISNFTLNPKDDNGELCSILRVKTALMGPVGLVGETDDFRENKYIPYITDEAKSMWLTDVFKTTGCIKVNDNNLYTIVEPDTSSVVNDYIFETQNFSYLMGELFNENVDTGVNFTDDDIVKICSCITLPSTIQSIAAEIYLFLSSWHYTSITGKSKDVDEDILKNFRNDLFSECINNAYMKVKAYNNKDALKIIGSVNFQRKTDQNTWKSYFTFEENIEADDSTNSVVRKDLIELYDAQKTWVYLINIYIDLVYISMLHNYNCIYNTRRFSAISKRMEKINGCLTNLKELNTQLVTTFRLKYQNVCDLADSIFGDIRNACTINTDKLQILLRSIKYVSKVSNMLLENTKCMIGQHGKINPITIYNHCACVSFKYADELDLENKILSIKKCLKSKVDSDDIIILPENCSPDIFNNSNIKQIWIMAKQDTGYQTLTRICLNILYSLNHNVKVVFFHDIGYPNAVKKSEKTVSDYICSPFYDFIQTFSSSYFLKIEYTPELVYCISKNRFDKNKFKKYMDSINASKFYDLVSEDTILNSDSNMFVNLKYKMKETKGNAKDGGKVFVNEKDIGIITVLNEETQAVVEQLQLNKRPSAFGERVYYEGELEGDGVIHKVALTQQLNQGQESVILAYNDLLRKFSPKIVFLVGIAGGIHKDSDYCNVVIGDEIIGYDKQKDTPNGISRRGSSYRIDAKMKPIIQSFMQGILKTPIKSSKNSKSDTISVHNENIGSGSAVVANELSEITKWIHNYNDKVFAVEMEAFGFSTAFYEGSLNDSSSACSVCIIRGISDLADTKKAKTKNYRFPAACNAAIVLKELVKYLPVFPEK